MSESTQKYNSSGTRHQIYDFQGKSGSDLAKPFVLKKIERGIPPITGPVFDLDPPFSGFLRQGGRGGVPIDISALEFQLLAASIRRLAGYSAANN